MLDGHLFVDAHVHVPVLGLAQAGLDRLGARLRSRRHPRGPVGRRRRAPARPARRAVRGAGRRPRAAVLRVLPARHRHPALRGPAADRRAQPDPVPARSRTSTRTCTSRSPTRCAASSTSARRRSSCTPCTAASGATTPALYPAYQVLAERGVPLIVHCGTSTFPGSMNELRRPGVPAAGGARLPDRRRRAGARRPRLVVRRGGVHGAGEPERLDRALRAAAEAAARTTSAATTSGGWRAAGSSPPTGPASRAPRRTRVTSSGSGCPTRWPPRCSVATPPGSTPA